jgi:hypothetical protein
VCSTRIDAILDSNFQEYLHTLHCPDASLCKDTILNFIEQCPDLEDVAIGGARSLDDEAVATLI